MANSPAAMLQIQRLNKSFAAMSMPEFVRKRHYHDVRGKFVLEKVQEHHIDSRQTLENLVPRENIISSIPISNSFIVKLNKSQMKLLSNVCDLKFLLLLLISFDFEFLYFPFYF